MPTTPSENVASPELRIMKLQDLIPHEMVIHKHVAKLVETIKLDRTQRDPIIVDRASSVVLDGTHRLRALSLAGATFAVVCLVDYDSIEIGRWLRQVSTGSPKHLVEELSLKSLVPIRPPSRALQMVENCETAFGLYSEQEAYVSNRSFNDIVEAYLLAEQIEHVLRSRQMRFSLIADSISLGDFSSFSSAQTILYTPQIEKTDVLHDFPIANLCMSERSLDTIGSVLASKLGTISPKLLPPGGNYHGRTYEERLLLYN